ncbi:hypothetical protein D0X99_18925 [Algoriphagus lacus]|uniref:DUF4136 domain-containing protein n=1 Tax=Algoriphagus lacus TaxID=2056311 RepID=A0A418PMV2_9BACT|nr:hypothetical protein [Algoriphagus lacus]RIW12586.1 hypothetical protein D0X99_18925 [Algoriphagus lacus]
MKKLSFLASLAVIFALASCSPSTKIIGSWSSPEKPASPYKKILVTGMTSNLVNRQAFEEELVATLIEDGVPATSSLNIIPVGSAATTEGMAKALETIRNSGHDGILTVALLDQTSETRYVQGTTTYAPMGYGGYYGRYSGYYGYYGAMTYDPGYYTTDKLYYIEVNLYDAKTEGLVWSSQSETTNPSNLESFSHTFAGVVVDQMIKDGIIAGPAKK